MAARKSSKGARKVTRAKATKKASARTSRKAPGLIVPAGTKRVLEIY